MLSSGGLSTYTIGGIVLTCSSPAIAINVWPRIELMAKTGISGSEIGIVILVTISALSLAAVPFAMQKAPNIGFWISCLLAGAGLIILNYIMAVGGIGKVRDNETKQASTHIYQHARLKSQIDELKTAKPKAPSRTTTEDMVRAADKAVEFAKLAVEQECGKVGDNCRARQAQLASRLDERAILGTDRAATIEQELHRELLRSLRAQLDLLGPPPQNIDPQAARVAAILGRWFDLGPQPIEWTADAIISFLAIFSELFALGMPRILVTAISPAVQIREVDTRPQRALLAAIPAAIEATRKALPQISGKTVRERASEDPLKWRDFHLEPNRQTRLKVTEAYLHYQNWCKAQKAQPRSFPAFDYELSQFYAKESTGGRTYYLKVKLKAT